MQWLCYKARVLKKNHANFVSDTIELSIYLYILFGFSYHNGSGHNLEHSLDGIHCRIMCAFFQTIPHISAMTFTSKWKQKQEIDDTI